jgi:DNA-binding beta-propeller fold protein YncE
MKNKIILFAAILLLLLACIWIFTDLFRNNKPVEKNPYDYGMKELRSSDSLPAYHELTPVRPLIKEITSVAASPDKKVFLAGKGGVEILDAAGHMLKMFSIPGNATCITCAKDGSLFMGMEDHVEHWSFSGFRLSSFENADTSSVITSVAADEKFVYAADAGKKIVYQYDIDGKFLSVIGEKDPVRKIPGFIIPSPFFDVGISPDGELWVANTGRYKLERYGADGALLSSWGEPSFALEGFSGCCNPTHFAFLADGSFVTSEKGIERVKVYSHKGTFRCLVAGPGAFDEGTRGLDLATTPDGKIYVVDPSRNQLRIFIPNEKP